MSITKSVEEYISQHPNTKGCLKNDLINFSSLSRRIMKDLKLKSKDFDAVLVACRRYQAKLSKEEHFEKRIKDVLSESKLEIKTGIVVFIIEKDVYFDYLLDIEKEIKKKMEVFHIIEGVNSLTLITTQDFAASIRKLFRNKIIRENSGLAELIIRTSNVIEKTPGVLSYLYSLFGDYNINIFETMSTWTDTLFIISENDLEKAVRILKFR
ncbi:MAG: ACT domain-containing protein [Nanoarchaeota archaeon]|nr:ACT domain-containing protein [Nanoarchaeota archaeon]MBU1704348.1 ACT domain-containing protein [Nanoarchaeota archaeon]